MKIKYDTLCSLIYEATKKELKKYDFLENSDMATYKHRLRLINTMYFSKNVNTFYNLLGFLRKIILNLNDTEGIIFKKFVDIEKRANEVYKHIKVGERLPFGLLGILKDFYNEVYGIRFMTNLFIGDNFKIKNNLNTLYNIIDEYVNKIENYKVKS